VHQFTVGQRRGIGFAAEVPLYVLSIDGGTGDVEVGPAELLASDAFFIERPNWLRWEQPPERFECEVQVRYRHTPVRAVVEAAAQARWRVSFVAPERAVSPGQAAVFYEGDEVLGGGWIVGPA
jgi:tRNA-specific 2-thiouridylase